MMAQNVTAVSYQDNKHKNTSTATMKTEERTAIEIFVLIAS